MSTLLHSLSQWWGRGKKVKVPIAGLSTHYHDSKCKYPFLKLMLCSVCSGLVGGGGGVKRVKKGQSGQVETGRGNRARPWLKPTKGIVNLKRPIKGVKESEGWGARGWRCRWETAAIWTKAARTEPAAQRRERKIHQRCVFGFSRGVLRGSTSPVRVKRSEKAGKAGVTSFSALMH